MIYTTYFANLKNLPKDIIPVSICGKAPEWYNGIQYKKLAPKYSFFSEWKKNKDNEYYIRHFKEEVLDQLNAVKVLWEIHDLLPVNPPVKHIALVCYEKPEDFCHRHLVAEWLKQNGFQCEEFRVSQKGEK